jgi:hypothetical protein
VDLSVQPSFQFWIKRTEDLSAPYCLSFEVSNGKGLLRVAHPDVLLDPPASGRGVQEGLSSEVVRASRFLLVSSNGRSRKGYFLAALGDAFLDRLPLGSWIELVPRTSGDMRLLLPLNLEATQHEPTTDAFDGPSDLSEHDTNPGQEQGSQRQRIRDVLSSHDAPSATGRAAPVVKERSWGDGDVSLFDFDDEHTDPSIGGDTIFLGGTEDEARALVGGALLASASMFDAPPSPNLEGPECDDAESAMSTLVDEVYAPGTDATSQDEEKDHELGPDGKPMPRIALAQLPIGAPRTALVRHLRRSAQRDQQRLERLEARVVELEAQLAAARQKLSERS